MELDNLIMLLCRIKVETGSLACFGCGHEHNCGIHGCAILREAVAALTTLTEENAQLRAELAQMQRERDSLKVYFLAVSSKPDCNTCSSIRDCQYRPRIGEPIRINCPLWRGPQKEE